MKGVYQTLSMNCFQKTIEYESSLFLERKKEEENFITIVYKEYKSHTLKN
jgi:hypothetical protein